MPKKYSMFWGCTILTRLPYVEAATRKVTDNLGIEIEDVAGASCCPEPYTIGLVGRDLRAALGARNIAIAEEIGLEMTTLCNGCYDTFCEVKEMLNDDKKLLKKVNRVMRQTGMKYSGNLPIRHFVEVLHEDVGLKRLKNRIKRRMNNLQVAVHSGCHIRKSEKVEDVEKKSQMLEEIVQTTGVEVVDYGLEKMCCGYPHRQADETLSLKETLATKLNSILKRDADCIITVCSGCNVQFEFGQMELKQRYQMSYKLPILNLTELLALSMGFSPQNIGLDRHRISTNPVIEKVV